MIEIDVVFISNAKDIRLEKETNLAIESLFKSEDPKEIKFNAIVVESNKEVNYDQYMFKSDMPRKITTIYPDVPFGYHRYLNIGRKAGNAEYVALCNNDLEFTRHWATNITKEMMTRGVWSASPANPNKDNHKKWIETGNVRMGWGVSNEIAGWCIFQNREIYKHIGDLDEIFEFWYCDNDYAMTLKSKGFYHIFVPTSHVFHHNGTQGSTLKKESNEARKTELTHGGQAIFTKKWIKKG